MNKVWALLAAGLFSTSLCAEEARPLKVGSKKFTEGIILGEVATQTLTAAGCPAVHLGEIGGTRVLFSALEQGEIDVYAEYTGTLSQEILKTEGVSTSREIAAVLAARDLGTSPPLGFNNTYALGVRPDLAERLAIRTLSDLRAHPELRLGLSNEFLERGDGWPSLRERYALPHENVRGLDHDLAYRALETGEIDVIDLYTTDAEIAYYGLRVLEDDLGYFPAYEAVFLYRLEIEKRCPAAIPALERLAGTIDEAHMQRMNAQVKLESRSEAEVAAELVNETLGLEITITKHGLGERLLRTTVEHLALVGSSLLAAILVAVPLGILAAHQRRLGQAVLGVVGVIQTIPALALLVLMIPLLGIAAPPAIAALFLYSLLPIVRNTHAGLVGIPRELIESAEALGLPPRARLMRIELPLALPSILAGIQTAAVINVGFATLGAIIGAGGYGQPILTGIRLDDFGLILEGALPAAVLALAVQGLFEVVERVLVPRGLRLGREG